MMSYTDYLQESPSPREFYEKIQHRRPILLRGQGSSCINPSLCNITLDRLQEIVGQENASVEVNELPKGHSPVISFSPQHSNNVSMPFSDLIQQIKSGSNRYYLTTQTLPLDEEGRPALYTTPVTQLVDQGYVQLRPKLLGHLVPMTYNLWIGNTTTTTTTLEQPNPSSSSGLHHDFHDNLYCLLQGSKTFRVAPPSAVHQMKMKGNFCKLYDNGRIVYEEQLGDGMIRPDGALEKIERMVQLEIQREEIERKLEDEVDGCEHLEDQLNAIEEEMLEFEMMDGSEKEKNDVDLLFRGNVKDDSSKNDDSDENSEVISNPPPDPKRLKVNHDIKELPPNFVMQESDQVQFETIQMEKGDLLYLPAGWFHEVFSHGGPHVAFNYWMHPPDVGTTFDTPYLSLFWQRDWEARQGNERV